MTADGIRALAAAAGISAGAAVLDLCCGTGGPGRLVAAETGCALVGVDADPDAVAVCRADATDPQQRYLVGRVPPVPGTGYDVVLLLETMLAFADKDALLAAVSQALVPSGRLACTVEEGVPLAAAERDAMPHADTVWPVTAPVFRAALAGAGLSILWEADVTAEHLAVVTALADALTSRRDEIAAVTGTAFVDDLIAAHRLWRDWMRTGRIRKRAVVAVRGAP